MEANVKTINKTVSKEKFKDNVFEIYSMLFEDAKRENLILEDLRGGGINLIVKVSTVNDDENSILFRNYGMKINKEGFNRVLKEVKRINNQQVDDNEDIENTILNRSTEYIVMNELSKHDLSNKVIARYNNGIVYGYNEGTVIDGIIMLSDEFKNEMSIKFAKLHSIKLDIPEMKKYSTHYDRTESVNELKIYLLKRAFEKIDQIDEYPYKNFPKMDQIEKNMNKISHKITELGFGDIGLCHNDPNPNNIIFNSKGKYLNKFNLIDWEMSMDNYIIFDLGFLFACYAGHPRYGFNPNLYPNDEYRLDFLRRYLKEKLRLANKVMNDQQFEKELQYLFVQTNLTTIHMLNGTANGLPGLDLEKELYNNPELDEIAKGDQFYFGKIAFQVHEFCQIKMDRFIKLADDYLKKYCQLIK